METTAPASQFEGWAVVEVMGHRRLAGYVTTKSFGSVIMFEVVVPEIPEQETTLAEDQYLNGRICGKGTRVATGRPRLAPMVGAASVYQITPCSEAEALQFQTPQTRVVEFVAPEARHQIRAAEQVEDLDFMNPDPDED